MEGKRRKEGREGHPARGKSVVLSSASVSSRSDQGSRIIPAKRYILLGLPPIYVEDLNNDSLPVSRDAGRPASPIRIDFGLRAESVDAVLVLLQESLAG